MLLSTSDLDLGTGEVDVPRNEPKMVLPRRNDGARDFLRAEQGTVDAMVGDRLQSEIAGGIRLRIEIDEQDAHATLSKTRRKIHGGGRLPDPALLICHRNDLHEGSGPYVAVTPWEDGSRNCRVLALPWRLAIVRRSRRMTPQIELSEKLLIEAGGWQAMKSARGLLAAGRVSNATWRPPELRGSVREGETEFRSGLRILSRTDIINLCTCRSSRQHGLICAHALAVGLQSLQPHVPHEPVKTLDAVQAPVSTTARSEIQIKGIRIGTEIGVPVELVIVFPVNLKATLEKGSVMVAPEVLLPDRKPLSALRSGTDYRFSPADFRLLQHLIHEAGGDLPAALSFSNVRFADLLPHLMGHPRVTLGRATSAVIHGETRRLVLRAEYAGEGDLRLQLDVPPNVRVVKSPAETWLFVEPASFEAVARGLPVAYSVLFSQEITIPASGVARFLEQERVVLERFFELRLPELLPVSSKSAEVPSFHLKLEGSLNHLEAELEARTGKGATTLTSQGYPERHAAESAALARLRRCGFQPSARGPWVLTSESAILQFFSRDLPGMEKDWKVTVGARFANITSNFERVQPIITMRGSGENWFEAGIEFSVGGTDRIAASEIRRLLQSGQKSVTLKNRKRVALHDGLLDEFNEVLRDCNPDQRQPGLYRFDSRDAAYVRSLEESAGVQIQEFSNAIPANARTNNSVPLGSLESVLRDYQKDGVYWLNDLRLNSFGGILADEMGLGKTVQALALLAHLGGNGLVVCPSSLVINWLREAQRFAPQLNAQPVAGPDRWADPQRLRGARLLITSYALLRRDLERYQEQEFTCVLLDEAQHIKNPQSQAAQAVFKLRARHRFALTGTPIENSVRDIWSIMNFLMPQYLGRQQDFKERYETPIAGTPGGAEHRRLIRRLTPFILRRTKKEVASELPDKIEQVLLCELGSDQRAAYGEILSHARQVVADLASSAPANQRRMTALTMLLRLRQACLDLRLLGATKGENVEKHERFPESAKLELLRELLDEAFLDGHRVLVFSQFATMLGLIREQLTAQSIESCYLDGQTRNRQAEVDRFQNGNAPVFLISLKAGGVGLNLTAADTVVHFDPWWNPAVEAQATDRAHRIGQTRVVTAYKLIARGTVEEKILALQSRKRAFSDLSVDSDEPLMGGLSDEELQEVIHGN